MTARLHLDPDVLLRTIWAGALVLNAVTLSLSFLSSGRADPVTSALAAGSVVGFAWTWKLVRW